VHICHCHAHARSPSAAPGSGRFRSVEPQTLDAYVAAACVLHAVWSPAKDSGSLPERPSIREIVEAASRDSPCPRLLESPVFLARTGMLVEGRVEWACMPMVADEGPTVFLLCTGLCSVSFWVQGKKGGI
jgi:hypothetical protein